MGKIVKKVLTISALLIIIAASICSFVYLVRNTERIDAKPVAVRENNGYPLVSDKRYCADVMVTYEYNSRLHNGIIEMDIKAAKAAENVSIHVFKGDGRLIPLGIITMPIYVAIICLIILISSLSMEDTIDETKKSAA